MCYLGPTNWLIVRVTHRLPRHVLLKALSTRLPLSVSFPDAVTPRPPSHPHRPSPCSSLLSTFTCPRFHCRASHWHHSIFHRVSALRHARGLLDDHANSCLISRHIPVPRSRSPLLWSSSTLPPYILANSAHVTGSFALQVHSSTMLRHDLLL